MPPTTLFHKIAYGSNIFTTIMTCIALIASPVTLNICVVFWVFNLSNVLMFSERIAPEIKNQAIKITMYVIIAIGHFLGFIMMFSEPVDASIVITILVNIMNFIISVTLFGLMLSESR